MINQYKRQDVFLCRHDCHQHSGQRVSVYHVMRRKQCFPEGCVYFRWKCKELEKRKKCFRGLTHVGKNCFGCKYFDEEKMTRTLSPSAGIDLENALESIYDFEEWLRDYENKEMICLGKINSVKPRIVKSVYPSNGASKEHTRLLGYLICFEYCYIGRTLLEDVSFAIVGCDFQKRLRFCAGDEIEFRGAFTEQEGRMIFQQLRQIDFKHKTDTADIWNDSRSLIVKHTGNMLARQADKCVDCDQGLLIDVHEFQNGAESVYHRIFCLQGMKSASLCLYVVSKDIYGNTCQNRYQKSNGKKH
jgi:hypothetical protein